jgi:hypothetical protein
MSRKANFSETRFLPTKITLQQILYCHASLPAANLKHGYAPYLGAVSAVGKGVRLASRESEQFPEFGKAEENAPTNEGSRR